jgi:hypothetical protein
MQIKYWIIMKLISLIFVAAALYVRVNALANVRIVVLLVAAVAAGRYYSISSLFFYWH